MADQDDIDRAKEAFEAVNGAIQEYAECLGVLTGRDMPYVNGWILAWNQDSIEYTRNDLDSYRVVSSQGLRRHEKLGLLKLASDSIGDSGKPPTIIQLRTDEEE